MSKRGAGNQITQDNWDAEDEVEEAGVFKLASENVMKERKVIKPRRKIGGEGVGGESGSTGAFKGFGGFGAAKPGAPAAGLFSFGTGASKPLSGLSNGSESKTGADFKLTSFQVKTDSTSSAKDDKESDKPKTDTNGVDKSDSAQRSKYLHQLKCLNEGVTKWIKQHVDKNPYCVLTPIFKDYDKHLAEIEQLNPDKSKETNDSSTKEESKEEPKSVTTTSSEPPKPVLSSTFSFGGSSMSATGTSSTSSGGTSLFGGFGSATKTSTLNTGTAIFGGAASSSGGSGFTFGTSSSSEAKPFGFATSSGASSSSADTGSKGAGGDDEEYVPPKAEISEITEEDSLYSRRCKMYYNKEGTWIEKGVGNLHLKPCNGKTQLLIRADTNLGNILLNIMLNKDMPFSRQGKNNVNFMCIPNPPLDKEEAKPTSILLRVKTGNDADDMLENINKHKGE